MLCSKLQRNVVGKQWLIAGLALGSMLLFLVRTCARSSAWTALLARSAD